MIVETNKISLNGIPIWYPELHYYEPSQDKDALAKLVELASMPEAMIEEGRDNQMRGYWRYKSRRGWVKLYGGKLVENVVQFMSRVDMSQSLLRIKARTNILPVQLEHDAAVWVIADSLVSPFSQVVEEEMTRAPTWLPDIPLACEISIGETM